MARIRSIKPEFCTSSQVAECSTSARLLFVLLWMFCDDNGVHPANAKQVKISAFPGDDITSAQILEWIDELLRVGLLAEFEAENTKFWYVTGWKRHQKIDRPQPGRYPLPPEFAEHSESNQRPIDERSTIARADGKKEGKKDGSSGKSDGALGKKEGGVIDEVISILCEVEAFAKKPPTEKRIGELVADFSELGDRAIVREARDARDWAQDNYRNGATGDAAKFFSNWLKRVKVQAEPDKEPERPPLRYTPEELERLTS